MAHALRNDPPFILENMNTQVNRWYILFRDFKKSYNGTYKDCLINGSEKEEFLHWLRAHRWIDPEELKIYFGKTFVNRALLKPFFCSPAAFKDFECKCHPERNKIKD